jgi:hypothetical protein
MHAPALLPAAQDLLAIGDTVRGLVPASRWCLRRMLSDNQLTGPIPDSLGSLSNLQNLCAGSGRKQKLARDGTRVLAAAETLGCYGSNAAPALIDGLVTPSSGFLPTLSSSLRRYLQWNQLTGAIPVSLGSLSSLQMLCAPVALAVRICGSVGRHAGAARRRLLRHCS